MPTLRSRVQGFPSSAPRVRRSGRQPPQLIVLSKQWLRRGWISSVAMGALESAARSARARGEELRVASRRARWRSIERRRASYRLQRSVAGSIFCLETATTRFRVLLVDDDEAVRTSSGEVLRSAGFEVTEAADGKRALEAMEAGAFDAVVLDLTMPVLDGIGVLNRMGPLPPVVVFTGGDYTQVVEAHGDRIFGVMRKPVAPGSLIALVGEAATAGRVERQ